MLSRLILVEHYWSRPKDSRTPLGHASLLAALRAEGVAEVRSLTHPVNGPDWCSQALADSNLTAAADCPAGTYGVGFGVYVWNDAQVQDVICSRHSSGQLNSSFPTLLLLWRFRSRLPTTSGIHRGDIDNTSDKSTGDHALTSNGLETLIDHLNNFGVKWRPAPLNSRTDAHQTHMARTLSTRIPGPVALLQCG